MTDDAGQQNAAAAELSMASRVNEVCDRFETSCRGIRPPRLEDYLAEFPESAASQVFRALLDIELTYRLRGGQNPTAAEYVARFPQQSAAIEAAFRQHAAKPHAAPPLPDTMIADGPGATIALPNGGAPSSGSTLGPAVGTPTSAGQRFHIVRPHAKGGLGEVFVAEDRELHRNVALKQIQGRFADDMNSRTRFVLEAEVTGALEHPGIVPVYGLGSYPDGRPFYAMRFIHGDSMKDAIDRFHGGEDGHGDPAQSDPAHRDPGQHVLELRKLLARFIAVCDAMEYAHRRGIVHRDLKPANIMLGEFGETLVVDWGLAKSIDRPESPAVPEEAPREPLSLSGTAPTQMGLAVGTPQFMSPEQAAGRPDLVGPHSDVYSLGATLYCLLTGKPPLDLPVMSLTELLRRVQTGEIPPARSVNASVPLPLDAICRKAMALAPADRYASARRLADDLEHWLGDEPISALQDTLAQRVARWTRRHKSWALATAVALVLVSVVSTAAFVLINRQRQIAQEQRRIAEENFHEARNAVDELFTKVSEDTLLNQPGMQGLRKELLQKTLDYYKRFLQQRENDPSVQDEMALTQFRVGRIVEELESPEKALPYYRAAQQSQERMLAAAPSEPQRLQELGDTFNGIGRAQQKGQQFDEALKAFQRAREIRQQLVQVQPGDREYQRALANSEMNIGWVEKNLGLLADAGRDIELAQASRRAQIASGAESLKLQRDLAMGYYDQGLLDRQLNSKKEAQTHLMDAVDGFELLIKHDPRDLSAQFQSALAYRVLGDLLSVGQPPEESIRLYSLARDRYARLVEANPDVSDYKLGLAELYMNMARKQKGAAAIESFTRARDLLAGLVETYPDDPQFGRDLAFTLRPLAENQVAAGNVNAARTNLSTALDLLTRLSEKSPKDTGLAAELTKTREALKKLGN